MGQKHRAATVPGPTMAEQADRHELYEWSVQNVESEVVFLKDTFKELRGREARTLREDFCGTASACCEWVRQGDDYQAYGVDIDPSVLDWGRKNRLSQLSDDQRGRLQLFESDVLTVQTPQVDMLSAFNFSYWIFMTREEMLVYFRRVRESLVDDGILFLDMFGGPEAQEETKEKTKHKKKGFTYIWHQAAFHPVTHFIRCHIHFRFKDGSKMKKAFTYEWRLWTAPELLELLREAGFSDPAVYWEGEDEDGEGNGEFTASNRGEADLAWIAYIVAKK